MKRLNQVDIALLVLLVAGLVLLLAGTGFVFTRGQQQTPASQDLVAGAQLYDSWFAALGVDPPPGNMPLWSRQSTNTRSGADTWRCSECHGWDYQGSQGAYASGSHYTGFPGVMQALQNMSVDEVMGQLRGQKDPAHDFSKYIDDAHLEQLATFLKLGLIDDSQYIDSTSLKVIGGDLQHGQQLFQQTCARCHGKDGTEKVFRTEGIDEYLGSVANRDPWRFLHRTRFGVAGTDMPIGYELGWIPADGRDVLKYVQTLPTGQESATPPPAGEESPPSPLFGGPAKNLWTGILTGMIAALGVVGSSLLFLSLFVLIVGVVVWALRSRR
jgi:mono/diheme cytochrome c family protein